VGPLRRWLIERTLRFLTRPLESHRRRVRNDPEALRRHARKGDVLLVHGDSRASAIIRALTQSTWSHAALYLGDEVLRRGGEQAEQARRRFGAEAGELLLEALPEGVVLSPLSKYVDFPIRLVRPHGLRREDRDRVLEAALSTIGWRYDLRSVLDLARWMIPATLVPARLRPRALHYGAGAPSRVMCTSLLGQLFERVRFPVAPIVEPSAAKPAAAPSRAGGVLRLLRRDAGGASAVFRARHPALLTPSDFDVSPYFEIVKFNVIAGGGFDYRRIEWASDGAAASTPAEPESTPRVRLLPAPAGPRGAA
jgi:hypothetical protein